MKDFKDYINEGGNVVIDGVEATRIDLRKVDRQDIVRKLDRSLAAINGHYKRFAGVPLWEKSLFRSKKFLSGSSLHFFNKAIPTPEFVAAKPTVGDIDTQVDKDMGEMVLKWLDSLGRSAKIGYLTFVGYKKSAGQYITLWQVDGYQLNVQVDLELVHYEGSKPTAWSQFSHSSSWADMNAQIKGVFHKYMLRALSTKSLRKTTVLTGKRETPKEVMTTDYAFSVQHGLRKKLEPTDKKNVYKEIPSKGAAYMTDLDMIFQTFFGKVPTTAEIAKFESFTGILELVNKYYTKAEKEKVATGFAFTLWGKGAQGIVRGNPEEDYATKRPAYDLLVKTLRLAPNKEHEQWIKEYYENYR